ncbi:MAG: hypothetical protein Q9222_006494 [Ikaeria aurantiellina]
MSHSILTSLEDSIASDILSFSSPLQPDHSVRTYDQTEQCSTLDCLEPRKKRPRIYPPSPPISPRFLEKPPLEGKVYIPSGYEASHTPSPGRVRRVVSDTVHLPLTPPGSDDGEGFGDPLGLGYPCRQRPLLQCGSLLQQGTNRGRIVYQRAYSTGSPSTPPSASTDRYISNRNSPQHPTKSFQLGKPPHLLTPDEKLLRNKSATLDPFVSHSPQRNQRGRALLASNHSRSNIRSQSRSVSGPDTLSLPDQANPLPQIRHASVGAVWNVGGGISIPTGPIEGISDGRGGLIGSGTNAPLYTAKFLDKDDSNDDQDTYENRLAMALDIDRTRRTLDFSRSRGRAGSIGMVRRRRTDTVLRSQWKYSQWTRDGDISPSKKATKQDPKPVPTIPFRVLDAPQLRDDYYCSVLAYSYTSRTLAVGLSNKVYLWSEAFGVQYPRMDDTARHNSYVTSLSFSSTGGGHSILAIGRNSGHISLWSLFDEGTRFESQQPNAVACLSFKPVTTQRRSVKFGTTVSTEELLVGDELGCVYYYTIEWVSNLDVDINGWHGAMSLLAKINVHSQQICGLAWSPNGEFFATGANDNACCLFVVSDVLGSQQTAARRKQHMRRPLGTLPIVHGLPNVMRSTSRWHKTPGTDSHASDVTEVPPISLAQRALSNPYIFRAIPGQNGILNIGEGRQRHKWIHSAAIKAIAFCPWQTGLLATGGGSNDRAIHFYHTSSGACLATITVQAQVTSLIWSTSRHEIAATFGYAQPEHSYRIAVFSWPACRQVVAIPWANEMRALHAISYPGSPSDKGKKAREGEAWWPRTNEEGCIVVACSDESVKFHEVWTGKKKSMGASAGLLGGSDILEALEGFDKEDVMVIR